MSDGNGSSLSQDDSRHLIEWQTSRELLSSFDNQLNDLRKYGFTFVTALLAAEAILVPYNPASPGQGVPDVVKFGVFSVSLLLVVALHLLDRNYVIFQEAAASRAKILERKLNLELTDIISQRYGKALGPRVVTLVYLLFVIGIVAFGGIVLSDNLPLVGLLGIFAVLAMVFNLSLGQSYRFQDAEDWTLSPIECVEDDQVQVTLTNLKGARRRDRVRLDSEIFKNMPESDEMKATMSKKRVKRPLVFNKGDLIYVVKKEGGSFAKEFRAEQRQLVYDSFTWLWNPRTQGDGPGVYEVRPRGWLLPLHKRIVVLDAEKGRRGK